MHAVLLHFVEWDWSGTLLHPFNLSNLYIRNRAKSVSKKMEMNKCTCAIVYGRFSIFLELFNNPDFNQSPNLNQTLILILNITLLLVLNLNPICDPGPNLNHKNQEYKQNRGTLSYKEFKSYAIHAYTLKVDVTWCRLFTASRPKLPKLKLIDLVKQIYLSLPSFILIFRKLNENKIMF